VMREAFEELPRYMHSQGSTGQVFWFATSAADQADCPTAPFGSGGP
jgi:hypothetical protein